MFAVSVTATFVFIFVGTMADSAGVESRVVVVRQYIRHSVTSKLSHIVARYGGVDMSTVQCGVLCSTHTSCQVFVFYKTNNSCFTYSSIQETHNTSQAFNSQGSKIFTINKEMMDNSDIHAGMTTENILTTEQKDVRCYKPRVPNASIRPPYWEYWEEREQVTYVCNFRYSFCRPNVDNVITCLSTGRWSEPKEQCHQNTWSPNGMPIVVSLTWPVSQGMFIKLTEKEPGWSDKETSIMCNLKGSSGALYHSFMSRYIDGKVKGKFILKRNGTDPNSTRSSITTKDYAFPLRHRENLELKFSIADKCVVISMNRNTVASYHVTYDVHIDKISVKGDIHIGFVRVEYPRSP